MEETYTRNAIVTDIHDGDTITVVVDLGFRASYTTPVRLNRINAAELSTDAGKKSRDYIKSILNIGDNVIIKTYKNPTDKYGRWLADVILPDGRNLNDTMVETRNAVYWDGTGPKVS